ncbi:uncharacterized protein [Chlorocebus sabaeus]|uniref:uncharacterized protein isoform X5 n=1 Tax=Chlorocebus sabaeus TaxID=60711 RepID=UPI003BF99A18
MYTWPSFRQPPTRPLPSLQQPGPSPSPTLFCQPCPHKAPPLAASPAPKAQLACSPAPLAPPHRLQAPSPRPSSSPPKRLHSSPAKSHPLLSSSHHLHSPAQHSTTPSRSPSFHPDSPALHQAPLHLHRHASRHVPLLPCPLPPPSTVHILLLAPPRPFRQAGRAPFTREHASPLAASFGLSAPLLPPIALCTALPPVPEQWRPALFIYSLSQRTLPFALTNRSGGRHGKPRPTPYVALSGGSLASPELVLRHVALWRAEGVEFSEAAERRSRHAHHRAWRWNSNRACERALQYQLGDKIHGFTINQDRDKDVHTCSADFHSLAMRAFSLTGAPSAISAGSYVYASVTKWKASGPGGACSNQERPESKKHSEQMHDAQGWMAGLTLLPRLE